jgi:hypothetical protein
MSFDPLSLSKGCREHGAPDLLDYSDSGLFGHPILLSAFFASCLINGLG